ncbi:serine protease gd [Solenopsis invicta]|uniref:serine protease gd n=1 Tax=Solenopsis invicta TaxID=13686 RepID=UPI00193DFE93|nr:serine protease gd [Solenopsis invicta]
MSINSTECGISNVIHNNRVRRIVNGTLIFHKERVRRGEWPWLAAIFVANRIGSIQFQCGGSVLTTKHVITGTLKNRRKTIRYEKVFYAYLLFLFKAAHCLKINSFDNDTFPPTVILVSVGRFNLNRLRERDSLNREVASYTIHPDFAHYLSADSDLAILTLRTPIQYGPFIRPICLWPEFN